jgi:hypothetical protein
MIANMRYTLPGVLMAGGVGWIVYQAQTLDGYYASGDVTRWEHASNAGSAPVVVGGSVVAAFVALAFLYCGAFSRRLSALAAVVGAAVYVVAWVVAWVALASGH